MTSIGETLRQERLRRQIPLEDVARELKISSRFLEAIEKEEFDRLPGGVFARSFVRQYAGMLDLHDEELDAQIQRIAEPVPQFPPARANNAYAPPVHLPPVKVWEASSESRFEWPSWAPSTAMLVVATLACSLVYAWWQRERSMATAQISLTTVTDTAPVSTVPETPNTSLPVGGEAEQAATSTPEKLTATAPPDSPESSPAPAAPDSNPNAPVRVAMTAEAPVWVSARADGKTLFTGTLAANQTQTVEAVGKLVLRVGNAGNIAITLNGKPVGALGARGQPRTVQFTSGGFQIDPAPNPSLVLLDPL